MNSCDDNTPLNDLDFNQEVDSNTIKNEIVIEKIQELIKTPPPPPPPPPEQRSLPPPQQPQAQSQNTMQVEKSIDHTPTEQPVNSNSPFHMKLYGTLKDNAKYLIVAFAAIVVQFGLYHIPFVHTYIDNISTVNSSKIKLLITFVSIFLLQKELLKWLNF